MKKSKAGSTKSTGVYRGKAGGIPSKIGGGTTYKGRSYSGHGSRLQNPSGAKSGRSRANRPLTKRTGGY